MEWHTAVLAHAGDTMWVLNVYQGLANQSYSRPLRRGPSLSLVPNGRNGGSERSSDFPKVTQPKGRARIQIFEKTLYLAARGRSRFGFCG